MLIQCKTAFLRCNKSNSNYGDNVVRSDVICFRPADYYADGAYTGTEEYACGFENKPGKRIPKAGYIAHAGVGRVGAEWSIFSVGAKGPHVSVQAEANGRLEAGAMARAGIGSASVAVGPAHIKVGLGIDTGIKISPTKIKVKVLGTGVTFGSTMGISFFGSEFKIKLL
uniref:Uncharacterized protein n=1 Tax=Paramormyrops kingsleyae TaxID=1676925 RepID=A0A3B3RQJ1_9TELE